MRRYLAAVLFIFALTFSSIVYGEDDAYELGCQAYDVGDYEAAYETWSPAALAGDAESQYGMGQLYANGYGVPLDDAEALKWYQKAADQGHGEAQCALGVMHANGWGVPMSETEAMKWYLLAAENGVTDARSTLALCTRMASAWSRTRSRHSSGSRLRPNWKTRMLQPSEITWLSVCRQRTSPRLMLP